MPKGSRRACLRPGQELIPDDGVRIVVAGGGRRFSFTALMVIGDGNGKVGLGYGKAKEAGLAVQKGLEEAKRSWGIVRRLQSVFGRIPLRPDPRKILTCWHRGEGCVIKAAAWNFGIRAAGICQNS